MSSPKVFLFISMSLDGYLATKDDDLTWLDMVDREGEDYGYYAFTDKIDKYIVGRKTYDVVNKLVGKFSQAELYDCYVISRTESGYKDGVTFYNGDIRSLITQLKQSSSKNIYCDGGGEIVKLLLEQQLIDEMIISIIPTLLGSGKRLFLEDFPSQNLTLLETKSFASGLVQLHYRASVKD